MIYANQIRSPKDSGTATEAQQMDHIFGAILQRVRLQAIEVAVFVTLKPMSLAGTYWIPSAVTLNCAYRRCRRDPTTT